MQKQFDRREKKKQKQNILLFDWSRQILSDVIYVYAESRKNDPM